MVFFDDSHSDRYEVISHCNFYLHYVKWSLSPGSYSNYNNSSTQFSIGTSLSYDILPYSNIAVNPSVSLAPGAKTTEGIGTADDPYVIE